MKKLLLVPTLISATALAVPAFAADLLPELSSDTITRLANSTRPEGWDQNIGVPTSISTDVVKACYASGVFSEGGWYWGMGNYQDANSADLTNVTSTGFTFDGRQAYSGEYVTAVVNLDDLLGDTGELLTSFTISFDMESTSSEGFHIYCVNTSTSEAVEFTSAADVVSGSIPTPGQLLQKKNIFQATTL